MIKPVFYNSVLVLILASLFAMPFAGFAFIGYDEPNIFGLNVLGASTVAKMPSDLDVVDQREYKVVLSQGSNSVTLYDVVADEFKSENYKKIVVYSMDIINSGVSATFSEDYSNLEFKASDPISENFEFSATVLILN